MATEIGETLRETRIRRKIDFADVESETKIRARYLRALENEEWDVLPGGAYTRSFIRTYANHLGLDGDRLADQYRRGVEDPIAAGYPGVDSPAPPAPRAPGRPQGGPRLQVSRGALAVLVSVGLIVLLIGIGLAGGGGGGGGGDEHGPSAAKKGAGGRGGTAQNSPAPSRVSVRLSALADVWVCLLDAKDAPVIDGQVLAAGAEEGPFRSRRFTVSFGNGEVQMQVNGQQVSIEDTPNPVGYAITSSGNLQPLSDAERPSCT